VLNIKLFYIFPNLPEAYIIAFNGDYSADTRISGRADVCDELLRSLPVKVLMPIKASKRVYYV